MSVRILKARIKVKDRGRNYNDILGALLRIVRKFDGFIELDLEVSDPIDEPKSKDHENLSDNQRQFVEDAMAQGFEVNYDYSGRGMFGRRCPAISLDRYTEFDTSADFSRDSLGMGKVYYASS